MVPRCLWARVESLALWQRYLEESGWGRAQRLGQKSLGGGLGQWGRAHVEDHAGCGQLLWTLTQARSGGQLLPGGHSGKQDEALHSASWSCLLREAPEGTLPRPPLLTRHGGACLWAPQLSRSERSHWHPIFRSVLEGGELWRQGHGVPQERASPVHPSLAR